MYDVFSHSLTVNKSHYLLNRLNRIQNFHITPLTATHGTPMISSTHNVSRGQSAAARLHAATSRQGVSQLNSRSYATIPPHTGPRPQALQSLEAASQDARVSFALMRTLASIIIVRVRGEVLLGELHALGTNNHRIAS